METKSDPSDIRTRIAWLVVGLLFAIGFIGITLERLDLRRQVQDLESQLQGKQTLSEVGKRHPLVAATYVDESTRLQNRIDPDALSECPKWNVTESDPPVSASRAIELAEAEISTINCPGNVSSPPGNSSKWVFQKAMLAQLEKSAATDDDHWCWRVEYSHETRSPGHIRYTYAEIWVLMDGSVIRPTAISLPAVKNSDPKRALEVGTDGMARAVP